MKHVKKSERGTEHKKLWYGSTGTLAIVCIVAIVFIVCLASSLIHNQNVAVSTKSSISNSAGNTGDVSGQAYSATTIPGDVASNGLTITHPYSDPTAYAYLRNDGN